MTRLLQSCRRIAPLAWPVFVGQIAVLAFSTVDTVMVARHSALDLAALAVGAAAYITVFIGLMGVVLAIGPIAGQLYGAGKWHECGRQLHQSMWLALALSVVGCLVLLFPQPFLALAETPPEVAVKVRGYLNGLAFALPMALLFTAYRGFNVAVSRPKAVMVLQLAALVLKVPLTALLVFGAVLPGPLAPFSMPALGAPGCGIATAAVMTLQMLAAWMLLQRDPFYERFGLRGRLKALHRESLAALLRLGVPMGLSILIEITGFTFMAFFISRIGAIPVAGHQIAVNLVATLFMMPLAIANAASTLVAQRVGAEDPADARRLGWHSLQAALLIAALMGGSVYLLRHRILALYTDDPVIVAAALPLLSWIALFHVADAAQTVGAFVLRAYRIVTVPLVVNVLAIWGIGLGGGYLVAFDLGGFSPPPLRGAAGFWSAAALGLYCAALAFASFLAWMFREQRRGERAPAAA